MLLQKTTVVYSKTVEKVFYTVQFYSIQFDLKNCYLHTPSVCVLVQCTVNKCIKILLAYVSIRVFGLSFIEIKDNFYLILYL